MTITLKLSADEARTLQELACAAGVSMETVLHGLIAQVSPPAASSASAPIPDALDLEALAEQQREQEEVEANIQRWHQERQAG